MKRSKRLFHCLRHYRRNRQAIQDKKDAVLLRRVTRKRPRATPLGLGFAPKFYRSRAQVLRAARRKIQLSLHRYKRLASHVAPVRLDYAQVVLYRQKLMRRRKRTAVKYTQQTLQRVRRVIPFLRAHTCRAFLKSVGNRYGRVRSATIRRALAATGAKTLMKSAFAERLLLARNSVRYGAWRCTSVKTRSFLQHRRKAFVCRKRPRTRKHSVARKMARSRARAIKRRHLQRLLRWFRHRRAGRRSALRVFCRTQVIRRRRKINVLARKTGKRGRKVMLLTREAKKRRRAKDALAKFKKTAHPRQQGGRHRKPSRRIFP